MCGNSQTIGTHWSTGTHRLQELTDPRGLVQGLTDPRKRAYSQELADMRELTDSKELADSKELVEL